MAAEAGADKDWEAEFKAACDGVKTFEPTKAVPNESKLAMYSLFKQATIGDCNTDRPGIFDFEGKAKWDAWDARKGMSKADAMKAYALEFEKQKTEFA